MLSNWDGYLKKNEKYKEVFINTLVLKKNESLAYKSIQAEQI